MNSPAGDVHKHLIAQCLAGDQAAFFELYQRYARAMYNTAYRITRSEDDAADAVQEAFISGFSKLGDLRGDASFGAWLKRIVINKALNQLKKNRQERLAGDDDVAEEESDDEYGDELTVERVRSAILQLPDGYRTVLSLYLLEGYDHEEIAGILGISQSTSKSQLNRSKKKLRELLRQGL